MGNDDLISRARKHLSPALYFHTGVVVKKASGVYIEATDGKTYLDFAAGLATSSLGHCHPAVVEACKKQLDQVIHSGCIFYYPSVVELAEKLTEITPSGIDMFFFSNSGAEAVEGAVKLAKYATGRQGVIGFSGAFHGRTGMAMTLTTSTAKYRKNYHPLMPSVYTAPYPYCYRCPMGQKQGDCNVECFDYLEGMLEDQILPEEVACFIFEPVLGEGGYIVPPKEYVVKLRELATKHGIMFISDEVQTGMGRTGHWFITEEHFGVKPDIMCLAKGIASGMPLSAVGATTEIMNKWSPGAHGTTFGGNPVSSAAACAVIDTVNNENLLPVIKENGKYALEKLTEIQGRHPIIGDVRGVGYMIGAEFVTPGTKKPEGERLARIIKKCEELGLIIVECGKYKNTARFMPPLIATREDMDKALKIFEEAIVATE